MPPHYDPGLEVYPFHRLLHHFSPGIQWGLISRRFSYPKKWPYTSKPLLRKKIEGGFKSEKKWISHGEGSYPFIGSEDGLTKPPSLPISSNSSWPEIS